MISLTKRLSINLLTKNQQQIRTLVIRSLAVSNLPLNISKEDLEEILTEKQISQRAVRVHKNSNGEATGLAFIDVAENEVEGSISRLDQVVVGDRLISVKLANPRQTGNILHDKKLKGELVTLMAYNLPGDITLQQLHDLFSTKVPVLAVRILNRDQQSSSKIGFIDVHPSNMSTAIKEFHDEVHFNGIIGVTLAAHTYMPAFRVLKNRQILTTLKLANVPENLSREELLTLLKREFPVFGLESSESGSWKVSILEGSVDRALNVLNSKLIEGNQLEASV